MATDSKIGWTHDTVNFWWGCVEAGPECDNCYARELDRMRGPLMDKNNPETHWGIHAPRWIQNGEGLRDQVPCGQFLRRPVFDSGLSKESGILPSREEFHFVVSQRSDSYP